MANLGVTVYGTHAIASIDGTAGEFRANRGFRSPITKFMQAGRTGYTLEMDSAIDILTEGGVWVSQANTAIGYTIVQPTSDPVCFFVTVKGVNAGDFDFWIEVKRILP